MALPENYHRDWQRRRAAENPDWYEERKNKRTNARRAKKAKFVQEFGGACNNCGGVFPDCVYEFHHTDPSQKDKTPSKLFMLSDENIRKELDKCVMLCANCHRIEHHEDGYVSHGKRQFSGVIGGKYGSNA